MVCWLPERFDDLIFRIDTLYKELLPLFEKDKDGKVDFLVISHIWRI